MSTKIPPVLDLAERIVEAVRNTGPKVMAIDAVVNLLVGAVGPTGTIAPSVRGLPMYKIGGDYTFEGRVVCTFEKLQSEERRIVTQDDRGLLLIMNPKQVRFR